jgi:hypothetical protein
MPKESFIHVVEYCRESLLGAKLLPSFEMQIELSV